MNPMELLQLKSAWDTFKANHPKLISFAKTVSKENFLDEASLIELTVTNSSGAAKTANIRVKREDMEFLRRIQEMFENSGSR